MYISANFSLLEQHQDHLDEELRIAQQIEHLLNARFMDESNNNLLDFNEYSRQSQFIQTEIRNIRERKQLLEDTLSALVDAKHDLTQSISKMHATL